MTDELGKLPSANDPLKIGKETGVRKPEAALAGGGAGIGPAGANSDIDADLQARLENLRRE